jgi:hypothetical protein
VPNKPVAPVIKPEQHHFQSKDGTIHVVDAKWAQIYSTRDDLKRIPKPEISQSDEDDED